MDIAVLHPYVAPFVLGCPIPVMNHNIRLSAIEFCNKTRWHEDECATTRAGATSVYDINPGTDLEIARITSVSVAGKKIEAETKSTGLRLIAAESVQAFFVALSASQIQINPNPATTDTVYVVASLRPAITATKIDDSLSEWLEAIAGGAISRITAIPKQEFTNSDISAYQRSIFLSGVQSALVKQGLGSSDIKLQRQIQTFF